MPTPACVHQRYPCTAGAVVVAVEVVVLMVEVLLLGASCATMQRAGQATSTKKNYQIVDHPCPPPSTVSKFGKRDKIPTGLQFASAFSP
jgi:hypothetical protein